MNELRHEVLCPELSRVLKWHHRGLTFIAEPVFTKKDIHVNCLSIKNNLLVELPSSIGFLRNLSTLYLSFNRLVKLPDTIGHLSNLLILDVHGNNLTSLPYSIQDCKTLQSLNLNGNCFVKFPDVIFRLKNLRMLYLSSNQLTTLPNCINTLHNLSLLFLKRNQIAILPDNLAMCPSLMSLSVEGNNLHYFPTKSMRRRTELTFDFNHNPNINYINLWAISQIINYSPVLDMHLQYGTFHYIVNNNFPSLDSTLTLTFRLYKKIQNPSLLLLPNNLIKISNSFEEIKTVPPLYETCLRKIFKILFDKRQLKSFDLSEIEHLIPLDIYKIIQDGFSMCCEYPFCHNPLVTYASVTAFRMRLNRAHTNIVKHVPVLVFFCGYYCAHLYKRDIESGRIKFNCSSMVSDGFKNVCQFELA